MQKAVAARLLPEDMVSTIFIFSDMEFDQASANAYDIYSSSYSSAAISSDPHLRALLDELPRREERTNFQGVKVCISRCASAALTTMPCGFTEEKRS